jgi:hypothetical protein
VIGALGFFANGKRTFEQGQCLSRPPLRAIDVLRKICQCVRDVRVIFPTYSLANGHRSSVFASRALEVAETRIGTREQR